MPDLPLRCHCGRMRGLATGVHPRAGVHIVCMCDDCQAYAHHLGTADLVLDAHGGTEVFQLTPAQLSISEGAAHLRCLRLSEGGLMRFYAGCCRVPIANTLASARMPFAGLVHTFMDFDAAGVEREALLGPAAHIQARFATTPPEPGKTRSSVGVILRSVGMIGRGFLGGAAHPSPFFDAESGAPVVAPEVLDAELLRRLRQQCGPASTV